MIDDATLGKRSGQGWKVPTTVIKQGKKLDESELQRVRDLRAAGWYADDIAMKLKLDFDSVQSACGVVQ